VCYPVELKKFTKLHYKGNLFIFLGPVQNDLKKNIAYSTCSQSGYMIFACGLSNYSVGIFHLANHAFFKALLFWVLGLLFIQCLMNKTLEKWVV
jgi:NADH:ubiquinone oxidoreductase subunit 5 (subunit L)/multisubunit Na+/H+ antiporter MnhA subunit